MFDTAPMGFMKKLMPQASPMMPEQTPVMGNMDVMPGRESGPMIGMGGAPPMMGGMEVPPPMPMAPPFQINNPMTPPPAPPGMGMGLRPQPMPQPNPMMPPPPMAGRDTSKGFPPSFGGAKGAGFNGLNKGKGKKTGLMNRLSSSMAPVANGMKKKQL